MRRPVLVLAIAVLFPAAELLAAGVRSGRSAWCGTTRYSGRDSVWAHRELRGRRGARAQSGRAASFDVGQIAVLLDEGDLALPRNSMDLQGSALRFSPTREGYSVTQLDLPLEPDTGTRLSLSDDDSARVPLGFSFPFYGRNYSEVYVNSDGNVTFDQKDDASTARNVGRLVNGLRGPRRS